MTNNNFDNNINTKQELGCMGVSPVIYYLEDKIGIEETKEAVEKLGLSIEFLKKQSNWVSYDYYKRLLNLLIELTQDKMAPYKASLFLKPQDMFSFVEFAVYSVFWTGSPKIVYQIGFGFNFYKRWTKIEDYKIIASTHNSVTVKHTMKQGYKHDKNNSLGLKGFMASVPTGIGLPPAKVDYHTEIIDGEEAGIYKISWKRRRSISKIFIAMLLILGSIGVEYLFLKEFVNLREFIIGNVLFVFMMFFMIQSFTTWKKYNINRNINEKQKKALLDEMEKREKDYNELLQIKKKVEERNVFLSIVNDVSELVTNFEDFHELIEMITKMLIYDMEFSAGILFKENPIDKHFEPEKMIGKGNSEDAFAIYFTENEHEEMKEHRTFFDIAELNTVKNNLDLQKFIQLNDFKEKIYFFDLEITHKFKYFILFFTKNTLKISDSIVYSIFENVYNHLKIGYKKISSDMAINNILANIPSFVIIIDTVDYTIKYINNYFFKYFPNSKKDKAYYINKDLFSIIAFDEKTKMEIIRRLINFEIEQELEPFETQINSLIIEFSFFIVPQFEGGEKMIGLIMNDITEKIYFQQKLLINEKLLMLGKVASGISHEINNPLYGVLANAEEIADNENLDKETREYAQEIIDHVVNVSNIVKDLSAYSKTLRKEEQDSVDINKVIEESIKLVRYGSNFLEVKIIKNLETLPNIKAAKGEIQQIFVNLLTNSVDAMEGRGTITINSFVEDSTIKISISDTGCGIPQDKLPYVFDLFYTTKEMGKGTGQGLHIIKKIVTKYNGRVEIQSEVNKGTTVFITFKFDKNKTDNNKIKSGE